MAEGKLKGRPSPVARMEVRRGRLERVDMAKAPPQAKIDVSIKFIHGHFLGVAVAAIRRPSHRTNPDVFDLIPAFLAVF